MAGMVDLVTQAQPALATVEGAGTEGRDWRWDFTGINDNAGDPIDLTAAAIECRIYFEDGNSFLLTAAGVVGGFSISATATETANLSGENGFHPRRCKWQCSITSGGYTVSVWNPNDSPFLIHGIGGSA